MHMMISSFSRPRWLVYGVLGAFAALMLPAGLAADSGSLSGFVFAKDSKSPVQGAVVKIRNTKDMKEMASGPTDENGMYALTGVPEGRYLLGVSSGREDFNLDYAVYVKAGELGKLSVSLAGKGGQDEPQGTTLGKKGFFNTLAGRIFVVSAVGVGLYFLIVEEGSRIR
jgi:hypothetical protein